MVLYDPIFGIYFLPVILVVRIFIYKFNKKHSGQGYLFDLDSDAEHQSDRSEHPV